MARLKVDEQALREALSITKGMLQDQMRGQEVQFARADSLVRLAVAELGGIVAVLGFLVARGYTAGPIWLGLVGTAVVTTFLALVILGFAAFGGWQLSILRIGPDAQQMNDAVLRQGAVRHELNISLIETLGDHVQTNQGILDRRHRLLGFGLFGLVISGALTLATTAYIAGVRILV